MEINTHFHFDTLVAVGIAWDTLPKGLILTFYAPFTVFVIAFHLPKTSTLQSITDQPCRCDKCGWSGIVWDCEGDVDGDGSLGCPNCLEVIEVIA